jgi:hypothetical protein
MRRKALEPWKDLATALDEERDPKPIRDLIEQLDHDLAEAPKNAPKRR